MYCMYVTKNNVKAPETTRDSPFNLRNFAWTLVRFRIHSLVALLQTPTSQKEFHTCVFRVHKYVSTSGVHLMYYVSQFSGK
jgi:hypothetical protein